MNTQRRNREGKAPAKIQAKKLTKKKQGASSKKPRKTRDTEGQDHRHLFDSPLIFSADREDEAPRRGPREDNGDLFDRSIFSSEI